MATGNKYHLTSETIDFDPKFRPCADLQVLDNEKDKSEFDRTTLVTLADDNGKTISIRFDWCNYSATSRVFGTLLVPETNKLFFAARFYWGVIDLQKVKIDRQETCAEFWDFERHKETIVIITELEAFALNFNGTTIDQVPIDPPFDRKDFEDRIDFNSPVYGQQTLKLKI